MELTLNGERVTANPREGESLLELLREEFGLCSVKDGCAPEGSCGACTVIVDGQAVVSCAQKATRVEGKHVMTQEGLPDEKRRMWADCFVAAGASQCGYCSPGIVLKAEALLEKNPEPVPRRDRARPAREPLPLHGVREDHRRDPARRRRSARGAAARAGRERTGRRRAVPRYNAAELALGDKPYVGDMTAHGHAPRRAALRRAPARSRAAHRHDPGEGPSRASWPSSRPPTCPATRTQGSLTKDWRQLVAEGEITAYVGDVLAVVAAESRYAAREAAALVEVEYEVLEPVADPFEALAVGAPALHHGGNVLSRLARRSRRRRHGARRRPRTSSRRRTGRSSSSMPSSSPSRRSSSPSPAARYACTRRARASGTTAARSPACSACPRTRCA